MNHVRLLKELRKSEINLAGGKAINLGEMINAGFNVPSGFCITTSAYEDYIYANNLELKIYDLLNSINVDDISSLENTSDNIKIFFDQKMIPSELKQSILLSYKDLENQCGIKNPPVAVRSSATAEDLPDHSFAGLQDTYLNVIGPDELINSVTKFWASLWTARAISYRIKNNISQNVLSIAVIVQKMVNSTSSGIMFSANPLTGKRTECVIDAIPGLGEALVSGITEPDHYEYDIHTGKLLRNTTGGKKIVIVPDKSGGTIKVENSTSLNETLSLQQIINLADNSLKISDHFKCPQDIEWAIEDDEIFIVQSRPITSLYPMPDKTQKENNTSFDIWFSFASWQVMMDPFTPLGQDIITNFAVSISNKLGFKTSDKTQNIFKAAGERLFVNIAPLFRVSFIRKQLPFIFSFIDPSLTEPIKKLLLDPRLMVNGRIYLKKTIKIVIFLFKIPFNTLLNMINPINRRKQILIFIDKIISDIKNNLEKVNTLNNTITLINTYDKYLPTLLLPRLISCIAAGQMAYQIISKIMIKNGISENEILNLTRGLSHNVTTEMDLELWELSRKIKNNTELADIFETNNSDVISDKYSNGLLPEIASTLIDNFIKQYGIRGIAEIDIGRKRWNEDPEYLMQILKNYIRIPDNDKSPSAIFEASRNAADASFERIINKLNESSKGRRKIKLIKFLFCRFREFGGMREFPKFSLMRIFDIFRKKLLSSGDELVKSDILKNREDIFFLHQYELEKLEDWKTPEFWELIQSRKTSYDREKKRKQIPRLMLGDGTSFYDGISSEDDSNDIISGSPVSNGIAEGIVRVVHDPLHSELKQGEIMVCPATDPAWTPLFLIAGGLIMEVGGMMTHGSVVAREYGIPAIVGVSNATTKFKTGQKVKLDGSTGKIYLI